MKINKNFRISKTQNGKGIQIEVPTQGFKYDHDAVYALAVESDGNKDRKHTVDRAAGYSMTKGFPTWAAPAIIDIKTGKVFIKPKKVKATK